MMKKIVVGLCFCIFCLVCSRAARGKPQQHVVLPLADNDHLTPHISLNGMWQVNINPPINFWLPENTVEKWTDIKVPGELRMQGLDVQQEVENAYKTRIDIPSTFQDKKIFIRFDGVYNYARVWVSGKFVREHYGGFTSWDCDITNFVEPGQSAQLVVGVTDRADDISGGSDYAKHTLAGILRDVTLFALPVNHIDMLRIDTQFDSLYTDAVLILHLGMQFSEKKSAQVKYRLLSPDGGAVKLEHPILHLDSASPVRTFLLPVASPQKWDAEHPNLYTLELQVFVDGAKIQNLARKIGFRQIEQRGNQVFVNGQDIKLRGANRHSIHPTDGRVLSDEWEKRDVFLAKEANMNFIRTSHYPPTEAFLKYCDEYGLYIEDETAVTFVAVNNDSTQDNPDFTERYLSQVKDMVTAHYNHPCVLAWSIGNESVYGTNFQQCYDWIKSIDKNRPVVFSYPATIPDDQKCTDFLSVHYPFFDKIQGELTSLYDPRIGKDKPFNYNHLPILYDEWAHVPAYNIQTIQRDPNVRNFWGRSIDDIWQSAFNTPGRLGGAIWCMIDDVFQLPPVGQDSAVTVSKFGNGEWGILDTRCRKKPEFWHTRKAYSPVFIKDKNIALEDASDSIELLVQNRFDHTNFDELEILWSTSQDSGRIDNADVAPHDWGHLLFFLKKWGERDSLRVYFYQHDQLIDEFCLPITIPSENKDQIAKIEKDVPPLKITEDKNQLTIFTTDFIIEFDKQSGLISRGDFNNCPLIQSGPHLQLLPIELAPWSLKEFSWKRIDKEIVVFIQGQHDSIGVNYKLKICGDGSMDIDVTIDNPPPAPGNGDTWWPRNGFAEVGVYFMVDGAMDRLSWKRRALWSVYPQDHIGRPIGTAFRYGLDKYFDSKKNVAWAQDTANPYRPDQSKNTGTTNDFKSMKENLYSAGIYSSDTGIGLQTISTGDHSIRLLPLGNKKDSPVKMIINTEWDYPDLGWGCFMKKPVQIQNGYCDSIHLKFTRIR